MEFEGVKAVAVDLLLEVHDLLLGKVNVRAHLADSSLPWVVANQ